MLCLGLIWATAPAFACTSMTDRDCCPEGAPSPCKGDESGFDLKAFASLCCVSAPVASSSATATADTHRSVDVEPQSPDSPDAIALLAWFATLQPREHERPPPPPDLVRTRTDAALTYLRTLRLRL
jgi:hypothetical protein